MSLRTSLSRILPFVTPGLRSLPIAAPSFTTLRLGTLCLAALGLVAGCGEGGSSTGSGTVKVQISGEDLALSGLSFPTGSEVTIADGWELQFSHVLVTVGEVRLSENPDRAPSDQSQTGDVVAREAGVWAVDLHVPGDETGAGGEGKATFLTTFESQTERGGAPLAAGERYAFSFDFAAAEEGANRTNFAGDAEAEALYGEMIAKGYSVLYTGTATFRGEACSVSDDTYDFSKVPQTLEFALGFATPTSYLNCQNEDNQGEPFEGEEYQRGVPIKDNEASLAQITVHLEHPFYAATHHEPALYFDQLAALLAGKPEGERLTLDDAIGVDAIGFTDGEGAPLPWRSCDGSSYPAGKQRSFDPGSVPLDPGAKPSVALRDYRDFVSYVQSTQGHMNGGEGLCFAKRNYPSPP